MVLLADTAADSNNPFGLNASLNSRTHAVKAALSESGPLEQSV